MPHTLFECEAILFDMDGTLVDSRDLVERIWLHWAAEHDIPPETVLAVAHGRPTLETMQIVAPELATPAEAERLDAFEAGLQGDERAVPGALELIAALPPHRWAVVTSAVHTIAATRLGLVGLPQPSVLVTADDVASGKPDPEGYLAAARALNVPPERCLVFEDTPAGVTAARAAGSRVIGLLTTFHGLDGCDWLVRDLRDVRIDGAVEKRIRVAIGPKVEPR